MTKEFILEVFPKTDCPLLSGEVLANQKESLIEKQKKDLQSFINQNESQHNNIREFQKLQIEKLLKKICHLESFLIQQQNEELGHLIKKFQNEFLTI